MIIEVTCRWSIPPQRRMAGFQRGAAARAALQLDANAGSTAHCYFADPHPSGYCPTASTAATLWESAGDRGGRSGLQPRGKAPGRPKGFQPKPAQRFLVIRKHPKKPKKPKKPLQSTG